MLIFGIVLSVSFEKMSQNGDYSLEKVYICSKNSFEKMLRRKIEGTLVRSLLQGLRGMSQLEWIDQMSARFDQQIMSPKQTIASFEKGTAGDSRFFIAIHFFVSSHLINSIFRLSTSDSSSMTSSFEGRGLNQG